MSLELILGGAAGILGLVAYLFKLLRDRDALRHELDGEKARNTTSELAGQIKESLDHVKETERDYVNLRNEFERKYGKGE